MMNNRNRNASSKPDYKYELVLHRPDGTVSIMRTNDEAEYKEWMKQNVRESSSQSHSTRVLLCD